MYIIVPTNSTYKTVPPERLQIFHSRNLNMLGTGYCVDRSWVLGTSGPVGCKVYCPPDPMPPRGLSRDRQGRVGGGGRGVGAGIATWAGRGHAAVMGVVVGTGVALCYDILMSGWERKKARHRTEMYLNEKLSHRIFLLTTAPRHTLKPPCGTLSEPSYPRLILRHLPMTRGARARQGRLQLVWGAGGAAGVTAVRCWEAMSRPGRDLPPRSILCQVCKFLR